MQKLFYEEKLFFPLMGNFIEELISGFGSISVVLSSSLISQTAAGNRGNLNKPFSRSKRPRFQNEAMSMVINVNFSYGRLNTRPRLNGLLVC